MSLARRGALISLILVLLAAGPAAWPRTDLPNAAGYSVLLPFVVKGYVPPPTRTGDWPQVQRDPQHTGYSPETLGTSFQRVWTYPFQPEKVHPQVQAIVYGGKVFVGTEMGNLYAIDAATGARLWTFRAGGPILASAAAGDGRVFVSSLDGAVYALGADTGAQVWKQQLSTRLGFSTAPVLAEGKVLLGGRDGRFYALAATTGSILWSYNVGSPILQTAASDQGRVFFGAMDVRVYAVNTANGSLAWQSGKLDGMALKDYWPVVTRGLVVVRPMGLGGIPVKNYSDSVQSQALAKYDASPTPKTMYVFDAATGRELPAVVHWDQAITMGGSTASPCVDRDGLLVIPAQKPDLYPDPWQAGWARLDLSTRKIVAGLIDSSNLSLGYGNRDETMNPTCTANGVIVMHTQEGNAQFTGFFDLNSQRWTRIAAGQTNKQLSTNTQGGGGNPASVANGLVYHISWHELIARRAN